MPKQYPSPIPYRSSLIAHHRLTVPPFILHNSTFILNNAMTRLNRSRSTMLDQILQFAADHPEIIAANPRAAALIAQLPAIANTLRTFGRDQASGHRLYRSGAQERATIAAALRKALRKIHNIAQIIDPAENPGVRPKFKMPIDSFRALADSARAFIQHATPIAHLFIERGRPSNFLTELATLIDTMEAAAQHKHHGRLKQVASTAGIEAEARRGVKIMRELDAILSDLLEADESLLATWKTATKVEAAPRRLFPDSSTPPESAPHRSSSDSSTPVNVTPQTSPTVPSNSLNLDTIPSPASTSAPAKGAWVCLRHSPFHSDSDPPGDRMGGATTSMPNTWHLNSPQLRRTATIDRDHRPNRASGSVERGFTFGDLHFIP